MTLVSRATSSRRRRESAVEAEFTRIHSTRAWGDGESVSGEGSSLEQTALIREAIPKLLRRLGVRSMLDAPCGDHHWMSQVDLVGIEYIGADIVEAIVEGNRKKYVADAASVGHGRGKRFERLDIITSPLPCVDLVLVRDCLVHLTLDQIQQATANIVTSGAKWLLATHFPGRENRDITMGQWRPLDMTAAPFHWPKPVEVINEGCTQNDGIFADKSLGLWDVGQLRAKRSPLTLTLSPEDGGEGTKAKDMRVAIVIPCHNYGRYLADCLDSVLRQTRPADEIVVVLDDCSDDSAEVAARYRGRGVRTLTVRCCGPWLSRRAGYRATDSDVVCFLDADDMLADDYLEAGVPLFSDGRVGIVTPWLDVIGQTTPMLGKSDTSLDIEQTNTVTSAALVRRAAVEQSGAMGGYSLVGLIHEDWHFWRKVARGGWKIADSPSRHIYRRHDSNRSLVTAGAFGKWAEVYAKEVGYVPPKKTRVVMLTQAASTGGLTLNTLHKLRAASLLEWVGIVLMDGATSDQASVDALGRFMPVYGGQPHDTANADTGVDRSLSVSKRLAELVAQCDAIYLWGTVDLELIEPYRATHAIIYAVHGQGAWSTSGAKKHADSADVVYCVSRAAQRAVPRTALAKSVVIHNGVDLASLEPRIGRDAVRSRWGCRPSDICVGFVGRISSEKNPVSLVTAIERLPKHFRGLYVTPHCARPAPHGAGLMAQIKSSSRARDLIWCEGLVDATDEGGLAMGDIYAGLDCVLIASTEEGGPLVLLEAMACGVPVVMTPVGLQAELERQHGRLTVEIPHGADGDTIAAAIREAVHPLNRATVERARELMIYEFNSLRLRTDFEAMVVSAVEEHCHELR